jgi:DNA-binding NarL/FixJ family response regulator
MSAPDGDRPIGVLIVDHQPLFRAGVAELLAKRPGFSIVGQAGTGAEAVALSSEFPPDVALIDLDVPGEDPSVTIKGIRRTSSAFMIGLSTRDDPFVVQESLSLGLSGYLLKTVTVEELASTIRGVCAQASAGNGRVIVSVSRTSLAPAEDADPDALSDREKEIMLLVAEGLSNAQVGKVLHIAEGTVKRHLRTVFIKLKAVSRIDAVNKAVARNLLPLSAGRAGGLGGPGPLLDPAPDERPG